MKDDCGTWCGVEGLKKALADMTARAESAESANGLIEVALAERDDAITRAEKAEKERDAWKRAHDDVRGMLERGGRDVLDMD